MSAHGASRPDGLDRTAPNDQHADRDLVRRFREGCQHSAYLLFHRYIKRLRTLARTRTSSSLATRCDHDDVLQSVFLEFFRKAGDGTYDVPAGEDFWNLLAVLTLNKVRARAVHHHAAKRDVRRTAGEIDPARLLDSLRSDADALAALKITVDETLGGLPAEHRQAMELRLEGYGIAEIAVSLHRSKRTVERILQECREKLGRACGAE